MSALVHSNRLMMGMIKGQYSGSPHKAHFPKRQSQSGFPLQTTINQHSSFTIKRVILRKRDLFFFFPAVNISPSLIFLLALFDSLYKGILSVTHQFFIPFRIMAGSQLRILARKDKSDYLVVILTQKGRHPFPLLFLQCVEDMVNA